MDTVRWGIIGCGNVTEVKSGPGFQKAQGSELVAVMRRDAALAEDYACRHNVSRWYGDADALIADQDVNAVYIATPPGTHEFYALKVAVAGKPCYVEKPMARNTAEAQRMVAAFQSKNLPLFVAYYRRVLPRFLKVREILRSGQLGDLHLIQYRYQDPQMKTRAAEIPWRLQAEHAGGGLFLDLGSHVLDLLDFFFGSLQAIRGTAENAAGAFDVEDQVLIRFGTSQTEGLAGWCFTDDRRLDEFTFVGSSAALRFSCFGNEPICLIHIQGVSRELSIARILSQGQLETFDLPNPEHVQQPLIQSVVDELLGRGTCESTGISALRTQQVMDAALTRYYGGREDGFWNRPWPKGS